ncbi:winged helix domain-containing protein [Roseovarius azorensis]|uniref:winged helix domain-containing protein n=1 Tax=Roseovarius azorensis TaxID=1287727 RepID=UPI003CCBD8B4
MGGGQGLTRNLRQQEPGRGSRQANAAGTPNIAQGKGRAKRAGLYHVTPSAGEPFNIVVSGRDAWALERLMAAGWKGCTPICEPAPRWSAYVFNLRELGVEIETLTEKHGGEFSGWHGRYMLRSDVRKGGAI